MTFFALNRIIIKHKTHTFSHSVFNFCSIPFKTKSENVDLKPFFNLILAYFIDGMMGGMM
jgi:formate/nitrite transporter FocA (FNT family)